MDPIFQSLLLNGGVGAGDKSGGGSGRSEGGGERRRPQSSRYARLIPNEALKPPAADVDGKDGAKRKKKKGKGVEDQAGKGGASDKDKDMDVSTSAASNGDGNLNAPGEQDREDVRVYRMDGATGQLELLPEENYDVVYYEGEDADEKPHGGDEDKSDAAEDSEMKVDEEGDDEKPKEEEAPGEGGEADANMDIDEEEPVGVGDEDTLYIVKVPPPPSTASPDEENDDTASSDSDSDDLLDGDGGITKSVPMHPDSRSREASSTASILARALASRTEGFDNLLQPETGLSEGGDANKKKDEVKKKLPFSSSSPLSGSGKAKPGERNGSKQPHAKGKEGAKGEAGIKKEEPSAQLLQSHSLIASLPKNANVIDGDSPRTLMQLSRMRRWQERHVEPAMQGIELENWEDDINWEGYTSSDNEEGKKEDSMDVDAATKDNAEDCTPDFKPPEPLGGHPKRARRTRLPHYEDPMLLLLEPRNPRLDALDLLSTVDWEGAPSGDESCDEVVNVPLILESSTAGRSVAALLAPRSSRPPPFDAHENYQRRYDREMKSAITSTADLARPLGLAGANEELERYKEMRQKKREQMAKDKQTRVTEVLSALSLTGTGRRITSSLMGPGGAERTGRPTRHALGASSAHDTEYVEQLEIVYNHALVKPELTLSEYRHFHRPRLPKSVVNPACPWQFKTRVITESKLSRAATTAADGSTIVGSYHAMMSAGSKAGNKIRNEADLSPTIGDLVVVEYSEERPPLCMTKGMTSRIVNYYRGDRSRCPISAGGGDRPLRKRHGDKAAASSDLGPAGPSNRAERPPRLLGPNQYTLKVADIVGLTSKKKKKSKETAAMEADKAKEDAIDVLPEGVTEILHQKVSGPFIGEVEEGKTQTGLVGNLFAAPMFRHDSEPTDFFMILGQLRDKPKPPVTSGGSSAASDNELGVVLRPLPPNIYCVGQTEPRLKVFVPNTNDEKKFVNAFIPYQVAKHIEKAEEKGGIGLSFDDVKERLFATSLIPHGQLRLRVKQVATFDRENDGVWGLKAIGEDNFPGVEAMGRKVSPEGVSAYESQCSAIRRLRDLGVSELYSGGSAINNVASVMVYLNGAVQAAMERRLMMKKILEVKRRLLTKKSSSEEDELRLVYFERAFEKLDEEYKEAKRRQEIAKFVYEEMQLTPWNITGEFIDVHKRAVGGAMMKLTGIGDPSGVGEAYNFLREGDSGRGKPGGSKNSDGALNAQIKKITGTENDLRKLTMKQMASLLRSYGMKEKQISVLKRWDRVHVIRDMSTKAVSDGMGDEMERFARGEKIRISDQRQNYKERIQEIWKRQVAALSATDEASSELAASSRSDQAMGTSSTKDTSDVDGGTGSEAGKGKDDASNDSDNSSDDEDFLAEMEVEMSNTGETNRLMTAQLRESGGGNSALDAQALSKDAGELAALRRQRDEERAMMQEGGLGQTGRPEVAKPKKKFKVIRRKVTKTRPDGTQTVTFEFIVDREKVDEVIAQQNLGDGKKKQKKKKKLGVFESPSPDDIVGHSMFEEDGNAKARRSLKLKIKRETRVIHKRGAGARKASQSKFASTIKHSRAQAQERKRKRMQLQEEAELYKHHSRGKGKTSRKERTREKLPHVILSDRLEEIRCAVEKRPNASAFHKPVPRDLYPQYYEIISEPIDLQTIRENNRKYMYNTADKFVADFQLMKQNAIKFNGRGSPLANEAVDMWEFVKATIEQNREEFNEMEEAVRDQMSGKKAKKATAKEGAMAETSGNAAPMNTANVVLDGVETKVNLGTNLSFGLDGDSDDSDED